MMNPVSQKNVLKCPFLRMQSCLTLKFWILHLDIATFMLTLKKGHFCQKKNKQNKQLYVFWILIVFQLC